MVTWFLVRSEWVSKGAQSVNVLTKVNELRPVNGKSRKQDAYNLARDSRNGVVAISENHWNSLKGDPGVRLVDPFTTAPVNAVVGEVENPDQLVGDEAQVLNVIARTGYRTLDDAEKTLKILFRGWFVYRGGNHVSLHRSSGAPRVLLLKEMR